MTDTEELSRFRAQLREAREQNQEGWERSRRLVAAAQAGTTLRRLASLVRGEASLPAAVKRLLQETVGEEDVDGIQDLSADALRRLTGLSATKAIRALCVFFRLVDLQPAPSVSHWTSERLEDFVRSETNPFDLLLTADVASLLDLGAGDLSFVEEVADRYAPAFTDRPSPLVLHAVDRLHPSSRLGGPLHAPAVRLRKLTALGPHLSCRFWGNLDMFALETNPQVWPMYTIVTCHAPPTPTFAYEPRRMTPAVIAEHLSATKGRYRQIRIDGEPALEVQHGGKALLFPPWKFEIRGPLALLDLLSRRGKLCVLSAIDNEVFWELMSQVVADPAVRPADVVFTTERLPKLFGPLYMQLSTLPLGEPMWLSDLTNVRGDLPRVLPPDGLTLMTPYRFRAIMIRRGATFAGMPASLTARLFTDMKEESTPWLMVLIP